MKIIKLIPILSISLLAVSCANQTTESNTIDNDNTNLDGKVLMETNCLVCHGNGTSHDDILAPPMKGVKNHYLSEGMTEKEFVTEIQNWVANPTKENSQMPGAVNRFGVMPKQEFSPDEVAAIATYMFNNEMPKPVWFDQHMKDQHGESNFTIEGLELNNGEKWKANPETTEGIDKMIQLTSSFTSEPTIEDYQNLGLSLEEQKKYILNQCTMDGIAHDNLHKYLMPLIRRINGIKEAESTDKGANILNYIKKHLAAYKDYFE